MSELMTKRRAELADLDDHAVVQLVESALAAAFDQPRAPRSGQYRAGVRAALYSRAGLRPVRNPFPAGSCESDAFLAGVDEGQALWRRARPAAEPPARADTGADPVALLI